ncbi:MAG: YdcF family protein [Candidatus Tectomicrobia bacterium]|nr:YdcF family protein [Candidatus Tectomicrobia bacterium]
MLRGFLLVVIIVIGISAVYRQVLLASAGRYLIHEDPLEKADAIVVLAGGVPDRILEAIDLYHKRYAPLIVMAKEEQNPAMHELKRFDITIPEGHDLNWLIAVKLGVFPESLMILDERVNSTYQELQSIYQYLLQKKMKSVILVSSKAHTTRVSKIFHSIAGDAIHVMVKPSKYDTFNPEEWWRARRDAKQVFLEYQKLLNFMALNF